MGTETLLIPGPVDVEPEVLAALSLPVRCHYGPEWAQFFNDTVALYQRVIGTTAETFIYVGSGHAGLDAALGSLLEDGDRVLVLSNGLFGERLADLARSHLAEVVEHRVPWGLPVDPDAVARALAIGPSVKLVAVVHNETSTGVVNPVEPIARHCRAAGTLLLVDGVSSVGGMPVAMDAWGVDCLVTASQKGLGAPPGLVMVSVGERCWQAIERRRRPIRGWYLNLLKWREFAQRQRHTQPYFITHASSNVVALRKSLELILTEGLEARYRRHHEVAATLRAAVAGLGLQTVAPEAAASPMVSVIRLPDGRSSPDLIGYLRSRYRVLVADGLGPFAGHVIRVGHMGRRATLDSVAVLQHAFHSWLRADQ